MFARRLLTIFCLAVFAIWKLPGSHGATPPRGPDVNGIIKNSYHFLLNREPEMTETEFAIYEEVLPMVFDEPEVAILLLETMLADDEPESPAFSFVLANVYYSSDRYDLAEKQYKSAIEGYPDFLRAWVNLGILYYTLENYPEAISCFTKAIELGNQDARIRGLLGYCLMELKNPLAAEEAFLQAFATDSKNHDWIEALINLYLDSKQYDRAELLIRELIKSEPDEKSYWTLYSSVLLSTERKVEAIIVLETLKMMGSPDINEILLLGDLYAEQRLFDEALATYETALKTESIAGRDRLVRYAKSLVQLESYDRAEKVISILTATDTREQSVELLEIQAQLHQGRNEFDQAIELLDRLLKIDPLNGEALLTLGRIYTSNEDYSKAQFLFEQARQIPESTFNASIELANLEIKDRHYQHAIKCLRDALRIRFLPQIEAHIQRLEALDASI